MIPDKKIAIICEGCRIRPAGPLFLNYCNQCALDEQAGWTTPEPTTEEKNMSSPERDALAEHLATKVVDGEEYNEADGIINALDRAGFKIIPNENISDLDRFAEEIRELEELLASIWLYVQWRKVTKELTIEQRERWVTAINASTPEDEPLDPLWRWWA